MNGNPLKREEIAELIASDRPLIQGYLEMDAQLQPNGFDLSVQQVARFNSRGQLGAANEDRRLPETEVMAFGAGGWLNLAPGSFLVTFNEVVSLPPDLMALGRPRSSLLRAGVSLHTAVWDADTGDARSPC